MKNYLGIDENDFQSFCNVLNIDLLCDYEKKAFVLSRASVPKEDFAKFFDVLKDDARHLKYSWEHRSKLDCGDLSKCSKSILEEKGDFYGVTEKDIEEILKLRQKAGAFNIFCILYHRGMTKDPSNQDLVSEIYVAMCLAAKRCKLFFA